MCLLWLDSSFHRVAPDIEKGQCFLPALCKEVFQKFDNLPSPLARASYRARLDAPNMIVVTANLRLARELQQEYDHEQEAAGRSSWPTPGILPLSAWLSEMWREWLFSGQAETAARLLRPAEERAIWENIVRSKTKNELLEVPRTAEAALASWNLLCAWNLPLDAPDWKDQEDSETFLGWVEEFRRRCRLNQWFSGAELPALVADLIEGGDLPVPEQVEFAGFLEPTPDRQRLFDCLAQRGTEVRQREIPQAAGKAVRLGLVDAAGEIGVAAQWVRRILESEPEAAAPNFRIGVVVPDLGGRRSQVERIFGETLHPRTRARQELDPRRLFNISLGLPASGYPIIETAFLLLGTDPRNIPIENAGRLLRSPFLQGSEEELTGRALLDVELRSMGEPYVSLRDIIRLARGGNGSRKCPKLASRLAAWTEQHQALQTSRMPSDWAPALSGFLQAVGWPGDRGIDSAEYQALEVWRELLFELARLDRVSGRISMGTAVGMLRHLGSTRQFQPESEPAPVQVLGVLEASGLRFDRLWIMGMHDNAWPAPPSPDPFLPFGLQRRFKLPRSSPDRQLEFARTLTARLLSSAPTVIASYPRREGDSDLRVSPLLTALPEVVEADLGLAASVGYPELLRRSSRMETVQDHRAPPCRDVPFRAGTLLFKLQAACPFRAFAELRLAARAPDDPEPGLNALDRGQLVHRILERVWEQLRSHRALVTIGEKELAELVSSQAGSEIREFAGFRRILRNTRFAAIEQERLEGVIGQWLVLEKQRQAFTMLEQEEGRRVTLGGLRMNIRADRVDRLEDGELVILDYKTGECRASDWDGPRPDEPQLPIYAATAGAPVAGVFFGSLKTGAFGFRGLAGSAGIVPGVKVPDDQPPLQETIEEWREVLDRLGRDFRAGEAVVNPKDPGKTCRHCALPALCRIGQAAAEPEGGHD